MGLMKSNPELLNLLAFPQVSFLLGMMLAQIGANLYWAEEQGISFKSIFKEFRQGVRPEDIPALSQAEAVISLAKRFLPRKFGLKDLAQTHIRAHYSDAQLSSYIKRGSDFVSAHQIAFQLGGAAVLQTYEDVVRIARSVNCLDDNTMQRLFVSASQAGVTVGQFLTMTDKYGLGDIWDGLTPEEAAARDQAQSQSYSQSTSGKQKSYRAYARSGGGEKSQKLAMFGLSLRASLKDLKKAYRKYAIKYHPDRNRGTAAKEKSATEKMAELNLAYDWLVDNW